MSSLQAELPIVIRMMMIIKSLISNDHLDHESRIDTGTNKNDDRNNMAQIEDGGQR